MLYTGKLNSRSPSLLTSESYKHVEHQQLLSSSLLLCPQIRKRMICYHRKCHYIYRGIAHHYCCSGLCAAHICLLFLNKLIILSSSAVIDFPRESALRRQYFALRRSIGAKNLLHDLHCDEGGFLTEEENASMKDESHNAEQVDKLIKVLLTQNEKRLRVVL